MTIGKRSKTIVDVWKREVGELSTRNFAHRRAASEDLVLRLDILRKLDKHRGCVNTVSFNAAGDILVSGSDDKRIILWDWETGQVKLSFYSGHSDNVFQAKIMPYTDDRSIVTCAADGQVRHAQILECGVETKLLAKHQGRAHKLAVEPGSPHIFYSCGEEDGLVQHIDLRTGSATSLFTCKPLPGQSDVPTVNLNAITIDPRNPNLFAVGGSDQFARLFDIRQHKWDGSSEFGRPVEFFCPPHLIDDDNVGITGLAFSEQSELLVSYNNEFIYLFTKDIGLVPEPTLTSQVSDGSDPGDVTPDYNPGLSLSLSQAGDNVKAAPQAYKGHRNCETVKGVSFFGPKCEYVVSGSDCGRIFIWKKKGGELVRVMEADKHIVNCIEAHPHATVLASSGIEHDIKMWIPKAIERATLPTNIQKDRVVSLIHHRIGFFPFGGFYDDDDDDDFINSDDEFIYSHDDDDDDDDDDDNDSVDDDDDGNSDNDDYSSDNDDDNYSENEVLNGGHLEEEEDNSTNCTVFGDANDNADFGSDHEFEEMSQSENDGDMDSAAAAAAASDDSFIDICDVDSYSEFGSDSDE